MDENQFKEIFIPISSKLFNLCCGVLGNKDDARDCLQDVFLKLWAGRRSLVHINNKEAYAYTITRNHCIDRLRGRRFNLQVDTIKEGTISEDSSTYSTDEDMRLQLISKALTYLSELQQRVLILRDFEGKEFDEIAQITKLSSENVRVTLSRARKKVKEVVEIEMKKQFRL